jgi:hypothetical protein
MIHIQGTRKETMYASTHDNRTKEDIDGIHIHDNVKTMIERKKTCTTT